MSTSICLCLCIFVCIGICICAGICKYMYIGIVRNKYVYIAATTFRESFPYQRTVEVYTCKKESDSTKRWEPNS